MRYTKSLTTSAFLASLSVVLTRFFGFIIPLGGLPTLSIDLGSIPIVFAGIILGPWFGALVGLSSDIIGFIINNRGGIFHFGFTLNAILAGFIPGLIFLRLKNLNLKLLNLGLIFFMTIIANGYLLLNFEISLLTVGISLLLILLLTVFIVIIISGEKYFKFNYQQFLKVLLVVTVVELVVYITLTPIWVYQLYNFPIIISVISRFFRALLLVPVKVLIIYQLLRIVRI